MDPFPRRIVCLTPETAAFLYALGAADRVVGVSAFAPDPPDGVARPVVSVFTTFRIEAIVALEPDLVIAFSDLQMEAVAALARRGIPVHLTNQRTLGQVLETMRLIGRMVGCEREAAGVLAPLGEALAAARREAAEAQARPVVYFEEWDDPMITGIGWVSELIEAAGGREAFPELAGRAEAEDRIIEPGAVLERAPDIIIASWCGKRARLDRIAARPGWDALPAVRAGRVHEVASGVCLRPGVNLIAEALPRFRRIVAAWRDGGAP